MRSAIFAENISNTPGATTKSPAARTARRGGLVMGSVPNFEERLRRLLHDDANVEPGAAGDVDERVEAEKADLSLQERVESRLRNPERPRRLSLRHAAAAEDLVDPHHQLGAQLQAFGLRFAKTEVTEHVSTASNALQLLAHRSARSRINARSLSLASSISRRAVLLDFF